MPLSGFHLHSSDYIVIFGYFLLLVLVVGIYFNKRQKASQDYFAGGHQVSWCAGRNLPLHVQLQCVHLHRLLANGVHVRLG